jgi:hypothetical protein
MADELSPTMDEGAVEEKQPEQMDENSQLLELLKSAGMTKPEQVEGTIRNAKRTFEMQSERDRIANELAELKRAFSEQKSKPSDQVDDYGQPVDLAGEMNRILDARERAKEQAMLQQQQRMMEAWNTITSDEDYHLVKGVWEEKLRDPNFVMGIQMGQKNPMQEYQNTLRTFYKGIVQKSGETIERLQKGGGAPPVHVESGEARTPQMPSTDEEISQSRELIDNLTENANKGKVLTEEDELAAIRTVFSGL